MSDAELLFLLRALLSGDPSASRRLVNACGARLVALLRSRHGLPVEILTDAANDALLALIAHPERYREERGSVMNYLVHIADHKVKDHLRALGRRREAAIGGTVELALVEAKNYREGAGDDGIPEDPEALQPEVESLIETILPAPRDRRLWELICQGRTEVTEYAAILEISDLPLERQQAETKRHRDRILKRVQRRRAEFRRLLYGES